MLGTGSDGVILTETGIEVPFSGREPAYFNYYWLRDNCPTSFDRQTRERVYDIFAEAVAPAAKSAAIADDCLVIEWHSDGHVTRHPLAFLAGNASGRPRPDPAALARKTWFGDHYPAMARFAQADLRADRDARATWIEAMLVDGVTIVDGMPATEAGLEETASLMGHVRPSFFGTTFEVKTHIKPTNLAFTANALELHTDLPSEECAPGIQFLHCLANSVEGGDSLFVDGAAVAEDLRQSHPEDFALLVGTDIPYYCEHDAFDMRARQRVIELDEAGAVSGVTISQHMADVFDLPQAFLDRYYPAFCRFGRMMQEEKYLMRFRLHAGECIVFDNHRIVHGRAAYSALSGDRHLRGCYVDRGEMRSTYRVLKGAGRFA